MNASELSDEELLGNLRASVSGEHEKTMWVLRYLREVEVRKLHIVYGHDSLYGFCQEDLQYTDDQAGLRIHVMRFMREQEGAEEKLENRELSLSVASKVRTAFRLYDPTPEERKEILELVSGVSKKEAERLLAARFPDPRPRERERPLDGELTEIRFTATKEMLEKFNRLKNLLAHKNYSGRYDLLFNELADLALKKLDPLQSQQDDSAQPGPDRKKNPESRHIPKKIRRAVWRRDDGRCQFRKPDGEICGSKHGVQLDHVKPFAEGGSHDLENLRLYCGAHNRVRNERPDL